MADPPPPSVGAGWYDDPEQPNVLRYWDGRAWSDDRAVAQSSEGPTPSPRKTGWQPSKMFLVGAVAVVVLVAIAVTSGDEDSNDGAAPPAGVSCEVVRYYVTGTARAASASTDLTMEAAGGTEQRTVRLPYERRVGCFEPGAFTYISAQKDDSTGSITCRITRDGFEVAKATSSGAYAIATCSD